MKKFLLTLGVAAMTLTAAAGTRVLYSQNFETVGTPAEAGWTYGGASMSIASDQWGKYLELSQGQTNGRTAQVKWGQEIFFDEEGNLLLEKDGIYTMTYDFCIVQGSNNQYNGAFTVFTNKKPVDNQPFRNPWNPAGYWQNYLFDMSQVAGEATQYAVNGGTLETTNDDGTTSFAIDYTDAVTFDAATWFTVTMEVNTLTRKVNYSVVSYQGDMVSSGTLEVPETNVAEVVEEGAEKTPISMLAEGLHIMVARYATIIDIDNIKISFESSTDFAAPPTVALTRFGQTADEELNLNLRAYTVTFGMEETLHLTGTDGATVDVAYDDCEGAYLYETTTSGTIKAWTTSGTATSDVVEVEVDCDPYILPVATATISSVSEGYAKSYTLTVDNSEVPLRPTIFLDYKFTGKSGNVVAEEGVASGYVVKVAEEGVLEVTTLAYGYKSNTESVNNDTPFATKKVYDFARMTKDEIDAALPGAAWSVTNSATTSGFTNWTARKRLYYVLEGSEHEVTNEETGEVSIVMDNVYPFGFISEEDTEHVLESAVIDRSAETEYDSNSYFEGLTIFPDKGKVATGLPNVGIIYRVGLYNDQTSNNNNNVVVNDLDATDFVVFNTIADYGSDSVHPVCATNDEYYAQLEGGNTVMLAKENGGTDAEGVFTGNGTYSATYALKRIDTALVKITIFKAGENGVEAVATEIVGDGYYYTIDGIRLAEPTQPGLYIHNGKKIIIK